MELFTKSLINNKNKKFEKDRRAFQNDRAYKWGSRNGTGRSRNDQGLRPLNMDNYASSTGNNNDASSISHSQVFSRGESHTPQAILRGRKRTKVGDGRSSFSKDKKKSKFTNGGGLNALGVLQGNGKDGLYKCTDQQKTTNTYLHGRSPKLKAPPAQQHFGNSPTPYTSSRDGPKDVWQHQPKQRERG